MRTINDFDILTAKIRVILQRAFIESRNLALARNSAQSYDLADTFEVVPALLDEPDETRLADLERILSAYQRKYPDTAYDYLSILHMNDTAFHECYPPAEEREPALAG
jgi:hypothetical protein